jgi:hypothetical protein
MRDEAVVGMPAVHMLSLTATGTPSSGWSSTLALPACSRVASMAAARARARSCTTVLKAPMRGSSARMRSRNASHTSTAERAPLATSRATARADCSMMALIR